jgi:hypothetical protein
MTRGNSSSQRPNSTKTHGDLAVLPLIANALQFLWDHLSTIVGMIGGGGIVGIWVLWRDRLRITALMLDEPFDIDGVAFVKVAPVFEVENIGGRPTSLKKDVIFTGYAPVGRRERLTSRLEIRDHTSRTLQPCQPKVITAAADKVPASYVFTWYRTYTFQPTRGRRRRVRTRSASVEHLGVLPFYIELLRFRLYGWMPDDTVK